MRDPASVVDLGEARRRAMPLSLDPGEPVLAPRPAVGPEDTADMLLDGSALNGAGLQLGVAHLPGCTCFDCWARQPAPYLGEFLGEVAPEPPKRRLTGRQKLLIVQLVGWLALLGGLAWAVRS